MPVGTAFHPRTLALCESLYSGSGQTPPLHAYHHSAKVVSTDACPTGSSAISGLAFENVTSVKEQRDGVTVLVFEGTIVSASAGAVEVPRLRIALRGDTGNEVYAWTAAPNRSILAPGEALPFRTRLASPPPEGRDVLVRFTHRRDGDAGR